MGRGLLDFKVERGRRKYVLYVVLDLTLSVSLLWQTSWIIQVHVINIDWWASVGTTVRPPTNQGTTWIRTDVFGAEEMISLDQLRRNWKFTCHFFFFFNSVFPPVCTTAEAAKLVMSLAILYLTVTDIITYCLAAVGFQFPVLVLLVMACCVKYKTRQQRSFIFSKLVPVYPGVIFQKHS